VLQVADKAAVVRLVLTLDKLAHHPAAMEVRPHLLEVAAVVWDAQQPVLLTVF
jgi:hypothetical protein